MMIVAVKSHDPWNGNWSMSFNIDYICEKAGKKEKDDDGKSFTPLKVSQVKKIFKLIRRYADEDLSYVGEYLEEKFPKMAEVWEKISA